MNRKIVKLIVFQLICCMVLGAFPAYAEDVDPQPEAVVKFGKYEQDNYTFNGEEAIEWLVLDEQDGKALLISRFLLDCIPYNTTNTDVTWETCSLRYWLNNDFLNAAFSVEEREAILETTVDNSAAQWPTSGGNNTTDLMFLLSNEEAEKYFNSDSSRICELTACALVEVGDIPWAWWLRSPGPTQDRATVVTKEGSLDDYSLVQNEYEAVRPAFWINLDADIFKSENPEGFSSFQVYAEDADLHPGAVVKFGDYEQDNDTANGEEAIEWFVFDVQDNKALLISRYVLDCQPYNTSWNSVTWETSSLRRWMNEDFLDAAFLDAEEDAILLTAVDNGRNQGKSSVQKDGGNNTKDKIFLLSYAEAKRYFLSDSDRVCECTAYAKTKQSIGGYMNIASWWLRSPGEYSGFTSCVDIHGSLEDQSFNTSDYIGVRPAVWVDLSAAVFDSDSSLWDREARAREKETRALERKERLENIKELPDELNKDDTALKNATGDKIVLYMEKSDGYSFSGYYYEDSIPAGLYAANVDEVGYIFSCSRSLLSKEVGYDVGIVDLKLEKRVIRAIEASSGRVLAEVTVQADIPQKVLVSEDGGRFSAKSIISESDRIDAYKKLCGEIGLEWGE